MSGAQVTLEPPDVVALFLGGPADGMRFAVALHHDRFEYRPPMAMKNPDLAAPAVEPMPYPRVVYTATRLRAGAKVVRVFVAPDVRHEDVVPLLVERYPRPQK